MATLEFRVLGPLEVRRDGELVPVRAPKQRALLGFLLLRANKAVPQRELIERLWGDDAPLNARASLYNHVHALRKLLGPGVLEREPTGYVVHAGPNQLDVARFERLVAEARRAEPRERAAKLRDALAHWRGPALVEIPMEPFAQDEIARLEEERLAALEDRIEAELELGLEVALVGELETLVDRHPLRERFWAQLMLALYRAGRQAEALATYARAHQVLVEELGVEPGPVLRELQRAILLQDASLDSVGHRLGSTLERAASVLPRTPPERAQSLYEYGVALLQTGERRRAVSTLAAAERLAAAAGVRGVVERARLYRSYISIWTDGKSPLAHLADTERAAQIFDELGDSDGVWLALWQQSQMLHLSGHPDAAVSAAERSAEIAARCGDPWQRARSRTGIAVSLADGTTHVASAIARCEAELAAAAGDERSPVGVWCALIVLYAEAGRIDESRALGEKAIADVRAAGLLWALLALLDYRAAAEVAVGNLDGAIAFLRTSHAICKAEDDHGGGPAVAAELGRLLALTGETDEARGLANAARAEAPNFFATEVNWRRARALVAAADGRLADALQLSDEARSLSAASDRLTMHAQTLEETATIASTMGDDARVGASLREALAVYERKGSVVGIARVRRRLEQAAG